MMHFGQRMSDLYLNRHFERAEESGVVRCALPAGPLAYLPTPVGGEIATRTTLQIVIESNGQMDPWDEVSSLVHSDDTAERGDHFVVETDELGQSLVRFGNGTNGRKIPDDAIVHCRYFPPALRQPDTGNAQWRHQVSFFR